MVDGIEYRGEFWEYDEEQDSLTVTYGGGSKAQCLDFMDNVRLNSERVRPEITFYLRDEGGSAQSINKYGVTVDSMWKWWMRCYYKDGIWISKPFLFDDEFRLKKIGDDGQSYVRAIYPWSGPVDTLRTSEVAFKHHSFDGERYGVVVDNEIYSLIGEARWYRLSECKIVSEQDMTVEPIMYDDVKRVYEERNRMFDDWLRERFHFDTESFCCNCGRLFRDGEGHQVSRYGNTSRYCTECYDELVHVCGHCGRETTSMGYWVDELGMWVEYDCYDDAMRSHGYELCNSCDRIYRVDDECEEGYCQTCSGELWGAMEHEYNYVPPMRFTHADKSVTAVENPGTRYIGCELEMEGGDCYRYRNMLCTRLKNEGFDRHVYFMHDGSLTDGCETATVPIELDYALSEYPFDTIHKVAQKCGMRSHQTDTCGLHIHVNRASIPDFELTMAKVLLTFDKFYDKLLTFSRRRQKDRPEHWCAKPNADIQKSDTPRELRDKLYVARDHYRAVNMLPSNTVEFRLWKGTHNPDTIRATIDFLSTLIDVCSETDLEKLYDWTWEEFIAAAAPKWKLEHTAEYVASRGLM